MKKQLPAHLCCSGFKSERGIVARSQIRPALEGCYWATSQHQEVKPKLRADCRSVLLGDLMGYSMKCMCVMCQAWSVSLT